MSDGISIDLGSALPYLEDRLFRLFRKNPETLLATQLLQRQMRLAARDAATVQIVGMDRPVPISQIYQPTRLKKAWRNHEVAFDSLATAGASAVIFGRPGVGKTVLLHYVYMTHADKDDCLPALFTLRRSGAVDDLVSLVRVASNKRLELASSTKLMLLVDGYDEISIEQRKAVSETLREYQSLALGPFYLTCRSYYHVDDTGAEHYEIAPFTRLDAEHF